MKLVKNGKQYIIGAIFGLCFIIGICLGAFMCSYMGENASRSISEYLSGFFSEFVNESNNAEVFKKSLGINTKIFAVIFVAGFIGAGYVICALCICAKGFVTGFTMAAFIRFYGINGIWIAAGNIPVNLVFIPLMLMFGVVSAGMSLNPFRMDRKRFGTYILVSAIIYIIFCICSLMDGYVTTSAMRLILKNILEISIK